MSDAVSQHGSSGAHAGPRFERIYDELRRLAHAKLRPADGAHSVEATAVVHEVWLRLSDAPELADTDESHYFALAAQAMRWILVDRARRRRSSQSSSGILANLTAAEAQDDGRILALDEALSRFESVYPRKAAVVAHRFFAGLSVEETARMLGTSPATVKREWAFARAWLIRELAMDIDAAGPVGGAEAAPAGDSADS